jgi:magnesium transporter
VLNTRGRVNPLYYVTFTTATLCASFILFSGFNTTDTVNTLSLLSGFLVTFTGVYLLNLSRADPNGMKMLAGRSTDATGTDMVSSLQTRLSMQARRSMDPRSSIGSRAHAEGEGLMRAYDEEAATGLHDLTEDSEDDSHTRRNGHASKQYESIELDSRKSSDR